jgi:hypothetical protein
MKRTITTALREMLARETRDGRTIADLIVEVIVRKALAGDIRFIKIILERTEGKVARGTAHPAVSPGRFYVVRPSDPAQPPADPIPCAVPLTPRLSGDRPREQSIPQSEPGRHGRAV